MRLSNFRFQLLNQFRSIVIIILIVTAFGLDVTVPVYAQAETARRERTVNQAPAAEATIILNEQFLNSFLDAMFTRLKEPEFPLSIVQNNAETNRETILAAHAPAAPNQICSSVIVLERERSGVKTAVHFENGQITAPLAFSGTYNTGLLGCLSFSGWASSVVTLEFDRDRKAIVARVRVTNVELNGVPRLASNVVIGLVQGSIDKRFNPYELFKTDQLSPVVPIKAAGGSLRLRAREMRPEIIPGALRIHIVYEFERAG